MFFVTFLIDAPTGNYLDHEIPDGGTAEEICNAVYPVSNRQDNNMTFKIYRCFFFQ